MTGPPNCLPNADAAARAQIRDAACVIVADLDGSKPRLLMGRRHADQVFLPDKWVFPGGRVEPADHALAARFAGDYAPRNLLPEIRPFALAALRELGEEAGLIIADSMRPSAVAARCDGETDEYNPAPARLLPLARAITPPGRVRRYDTWFFMASRNAVLHAPKKPDGELLDLNWFTLAEARQLDLPRITGFVLEDAAARLDDAADALSSSVASLPLYHSGDCGFQRTLISCTTALCTP